MELGVDMPVPSMADKPDPALRTLKVELLSNGSFISCVPNAREPTPFETDFFKGQAMILVRTNPIDELYKSIFLGRKRLFEVQVQGKFKREPLGEIYVGAEATSKMELGLLTRAFSRAAMKFCATLVDDLHFSFGDDPQDPSYQLPHAVAPIFPTFDKVIATPLGGIPPKLGVPFVEDPDYGKKRLKFRYIKDAEVDMDTTYSFTVNTSQLDLLAWTLVGIPMMRPMDLRTFFGNSSIQLIGYEVPKSVNMKYPDIHPQKFLNYVFCMRLSPVNPNDCPLDLPVVSSDDDCGVDVEDDELIVTENDEKVLKVVKSPSVLDEEELGDENSSESSDEFLDENESHYHINGPLLHEVDEKHVGNLSGSSIRSGRNSMSGWFKFGRKDKQKRDGEDKTVGFEIHESSEFVDPDIDMESIGDLSFCSACIEINYDGKRKFVYLMSIPDILRNELQINNVSISNEIQLSPFDAVSPRLRTYSDIIKHLQMVPIPKLHKNKRLSTVEKRRRQVVESYRTLMKSDSSNSTKKFLQFLSTIQDLDRNFLGGNIPLHVKSNKDGGVCYEGYVALAMSRRHFTEQIMTLNKEYLSFKSSVESKKYNILIKIQNIISVQSVRPDNCLIMGHFGFLQIETWSRVYYILLRSDMQVNEWLQSFVTILGNNCTDNPYRSVYLSEKSTPQVLENGAVKIIGIGPTNALSNNINAMSFLDREELIYYARPSCWKLDSKRRVYNYRQILFRTVYENSSGTNTKDFDPNNLVENILQHAFYLVKAIQHNTVNDIDWMKFWDDISLLQTIDLSNLNESQRMAFFLNLYHIMILHGSLLYGPPPVWNQWHAFFNHICYIVSFEVMSIAEIEYCILRSSMSKLSHFSAVALTAPPQTQFPHLALSSRDFRLHFAINCGSLSQIELVPIYRWPTLDAQLDEITRISLDYGLEIDMTKKLVIMPKLPLQDYSISSPNTQPPVGSRPSVNSANIVDCLRVLAPYLSKQKRVFVKQILSDPQSFTIKHRTYNFKCRFLKKLEDLDDATSKAVITN